jgi:hypothetical protein
VRRLLLTLAIAVAACDLPEPVALVDGWPVGAVYGCSEPRCEPYIRVAVDGLDGRDAGHAPIIGATLHELGLMVGTDGRPVSLAYSGGQPSVVLFQLADGSVRAIGVKYHGVSRQASAVDWGPGLDHGPPPGR